ncbi:hypothetical protein D0469_17750 [Peribacillus saganii]|uniref:Uncharacterized protein n=1 Tax=Peribacillus saganii TaxID=2303992 RepID=A0A372LKJ1_9BACI|nr:hypothetical protein [Peribacillus saganii]RFU66182.1 hypothetical protein D0469_17750 [Peribacillus saganii]
MAINQIKNMLNELIHYKDPEITHIYSRYEVPFSVTLKKGETPHRFIITFMEEENVELLANLETSVRIMDELIELQEEVT